MMKKILLVSLVFTFVLDVSATIPPAIEAFLERVAGDEGKRIELKLEDNDGQEFFHISSQSGTTFITANSLSALTRGVGWHLSHKTNKNHDGKHFCRDKYRYFLNYCTFAYSTLSWDWDKWQEEIDWMALHGVNMPLQIIGIESVWHDFLEKDCHFNDNFTPGTPYLPWWLMSNLEGLGHKSDDSWYENRAELGRKIMQREKEMGMMPVLPGFSGMMPSDFPETESQGEWCGVKRPGLLDPTKPVFQRLAQKFYKRLEKVLGTTEFYSMDPFHEGGNIRSGRYHEAYKAIFEAMNTNCGKSSKWVIQQWQWAPQQAECLTAVDEKRLIVLDLYSDARPGFEAYDYYQPHEAVYCTIPNFGGRTGLFGRLEQTVDNYFSCHEASANVTGVGSAPEGIGQAEMNYDLLFELPWMDEKPDCRKWVSDYMQERYHTSDERAAEVGILLLETVYGNHSALQGPHEAIVCARPRKNPESVSAWGSTEIFYDVKKLQKALKLLQEMPVPEDENAREKYEYDLCDIQRQVLTDSAQVLINQPDKFLQIILDLDSLLGTRKEFRLDNGYADAESLRLITTWGDYENSEIGQLHDYSYRELQGLLRNFYYVRWKYWFEHGKEPKEGWYDFERKILTSNPS